MTHTPSTVKTHGGGRQPRALQIWSWHLHYIRMLKVNVKSASSPKPTWQLKAQTKIVCHLTLCELLEAHGLGLSMNLRVLRSTVNTVHIYLFLSTKSSVIKQSFVFHWSLFMTDLVQRDIFPDLDEWNFCMDSNTINQKYSICWLGGCSSEMPWEARGFDRNREKESFCGRAFGEIFLSKWRTWDERNTSCSCHYLLDSKCYEDIPPADTPLAEYSVRIYLFDVDIIERETFLWQSLLNVVPVGLTQQQAGYEHEFNDIHVIHNFVRTLFLFYTHWQYILIIKFAWEHFSGKIEKNYITLPTKKQIWAYYSRR